MVLAFARIHRLRSQVSLSALFHLNGSVFPFATKVALPCAAVAFLLKYAQVQGWDIVCEVLESAEMDATVYQAFSTLLGILVVFRTGQAYNRFWDGSTLTHQMRGDWFDAASSIVSFTRTSKADPQALWEFRQIVVRLFSMLHALSLAELEDDDDKDEERWAYRLRVIDGTGIDVPSLRHLKKAECKVELVFHWIQSIVVTSIECGIMSAPSPILTRAYSELAAGMVKFHDCLKIARISVPFPYSQATLLLLVMHWLLTPFVMTQGTQSPTVSCIFTFVTVFILWGLHSISIELENPFGADANDLDVHDMQHDMNNRLLLLLDPVSASIPTLSGNHVQDHGVLLNMERNRTMPSFESMWRALASEVEQGGDLKRVRRSSTQLKRGSFACKKSNSQISLNTYMGRVRDVVSTRTIRLPWGRKPSEVRGSRSERSNASGRSCKSGKAPRSAASQSSIQGSDSPSLDTEAMVAIPSVLAPVEEEVIQGRNGTRLLEAVSEWSSYGNPVSDTSQPQYRQSVSWAVPLDGPCEPEDWELEAAAVGAEVSQPQSAHHDMHGGLTQGI